MAVAGHRATLTVALLLAAAGVLPAGAQSDAPPLVVGTCVDPPFAMKSPGGEWRGIAIELWRDIAAREHLAFRLEEFEFDALVEAVAAGRVDVAVAPLLITADHERRFDLTSPFMHIALAIATRPAGTTEWVRAIARTLGGTVLKATLGLLAVMVFFALVIWVIERRRNPDHFGGTRMRGIADAIWWSATTMTTVGYGDRTPITFWGRAVGVVWMIVSIVIVSAFIATVSSTLTLARLQPQFHSLHDLARVRTAVVQESGAADVLAAMHIDSVNYPDVEAAMDDLVRGQIDAVVDEAPVLRYLAKARYQHRVSVLTQSLSRGFVALGLPQDSPRRRQIDMALLQALDDPAWQNLVRKFLAD